MAFDTSIFTKPPKGFAPTDQEEGKGNDKAQEYDTAYGKGVTTSSDMEGDCSLVFTENAPTLGKKTVVFGKGKTGKSDTALIKGAILTKLDKCNTEGDVTELIFYLVKEKLNIDVTLDGNTVTIKVPINPNSSNNSVMYTVTLALLKAHSDLAEYRIGYLHSTQTVSLSSLDACHITSMRV